LAGEFKLAERISLNAPRAKPVVEIKVHAAFSIIGVVGAQQLARINIRVLPGSRAIEFSHLLATLPQRPARVNVPGHPARSEVAAQRSQPQTGNANPRRIVDIPRDAANGVLDRANPPFSIVEIRVEPVVSHIPRRVIGQPRARIEARIGDLIAGIVLRHAGAERRSEEGICVHEVYT